MITSEKSSVFQYKTYRSVVLHTHTHTYTHTQEGTWRNFYINDESIYMYLCVCGQVEKDRDRETGDFLKYQCLCFSYRIKL